MIDTRELLGKVAALRQRLDQAHSLERRTAGLAALADEAAAGHAQVAELQSIVHPVTSRVGEEVPPATVQLTARARRAVELGRDLLAKLRTLAGAFEDAAGKPCFDPDEPRARYYRETVALADTALRLVPLFPPAASAQLRLCDGLDAILEVVARRQRHLQAAVQRARREEERLTRLAELLTDLHAERPVPAATLENLADEVLLEAAEAQPLQWSMASADEPARYLAGHALATAAVMARIAHHAWDLIEQPREPILAALVHDVGMLQVPVEILACSERLSEQQRRLVESHCRRGADLVARVWPHQASLANAALSHHERMDGTGYPNGAPGAKQAMLSRLLAVCDVYAALCAPRPHRPALDTRTALTDTLLLAEQGRLDGRCAQALLYLSFYPTGTAVELADGSIGVVVATAAPGRDLRNPARPVVALLLDPEGQAYPAPRHLDLLLCDAPSIVRSLGRAERRAALGRQHVEWL